MKLMMKFYLCLHICLHIFLEFPWKLFWCYFRQLFMSLGLRKCKKDCKIPKIILVQGVCRLKAEIARFAIGYRLNLEVLALLRCHLSVC